MNNHNNILCFRKYFSRVSLPEKLCENPIEVRKLVEKMDAFYETLEEIKKNLH